LQWFSSACATLRTVGFQISDSHRVAQNLRRFAGKILWTVENDRELRGLPFAGARGMSPGQNSTIIERRNAAQEVAA
jgi:hypothetical protein